jgi:hypothetical protein
MFAWNVHQATILDPELSRKIQIGISKLGKKPASEVWGCTVHACSIPVVWSVRASIPLCPAFVVRCLCMQVIDAIESFDVEGLGGYEVVKALLAMSCYEQVTISAVKGAYTASAPPPRHPHLPPPSPHLCTASLTRVWMPACEHRPRFPGVFHGAPKGTSTHSSLAPRHAH